MKADKKLLSSVIIVVSITLLGGCSTTPGSTSVHGSMSYGYGGYYDPYPYWGRGGDTTVIIKNPDQPDRPRPEPPAARPKPPGGIGRPRPRRR